MIQKRLLANKRWIGLPSDHFGQDWEKLISKIDEFIDGSSLDLAEESIYIQFDGSPAAVLEGLGHAVVMRSVIGPKIELEAPLFVQDWICSTVYSAELVEDSWEVALGKAQLFWEKLIREGETVLPAFTLILKRRLVPLLKLEIDVFFQAT